MAIELTVEQLNAAKILAKYLADVYPPVHPPSIVEFAEKSFYIPETGEPITLQPHQKSILSYALDKHDFQTIVYSTIKKSGKTTIGALIARWVAETWGRYPEVICAANDMEQARGRIYQKIEESIELTPGYNKDKRELPGKWKIIERHAVHSPNRGVIRSISGDYKGEAGANPSASIFSELWAYTLEKSRRLYEELTPVPTRERSIRVIETYAGFEDESDLLLDIYKLGLKGRRLTHDDIDWPFPDQPPIWVNDNASLFMYWDEDVAARRMPWQTQDYYTKQAQILRPQAFERLHLNKWTTSVGQFIPIEWWDACLENLPPLDDKTPVVIGADAAVSSDCSGIVGVSRHPVRPNDIAIRFAEVWYPPTGGTINLTETVEAAIRDKCKRYNVVQVAYDEYQLHQMTTDLVNEGIVWCRKFSQFAAREIADKQLYDMIRDKHLAHPGIDIIKEHLKNALAKQARDEDTKLRIVKKGTAAKIDLAVAMSMAISECKRLIL